MIMLADGRHQPSQNATALFADGVCEVFNIEAGHVVIFHFSESDEHRVISPEKLRNIRKVANGAYEVGIFSFAA